MNTKDKTIAAFSGELSSAAPAPGGGGAAALSAALGISLGLMVANLTVGKKRYEAQQERIAEIIDLFLPLREQALLLADADEAVFLPLYAAYKLPKGTAEEAAHKEAVMESCLKDAVSVPLDTMRLCLAALPLLKELISIGNRMAVSDVGAGASMLRSALHAAALNVSINTASMKNRGIAEAYDAQSAALLSDGAALADAIYQEVAACLSAK